MPSFCHNNIQYNSYKNEVIFSYIKYGNIYPDYLTILIIVRYGSGVVLLNLKKNYKLKNYF